MSLSLVFGGASLSVGVATSVPDNVQGVEQALRDAAYGLATTAQACWRDQGSSQTSSAVRAGLDLAEPAFGEFVALAGASAPEVLVLMVGLRALRRCVRAATRAAVGAGPGLDAGVGAGELVSGGCS